MLILNVDLEIPLDVLYKWSLGVINLGMDVWRPTDRFVRITSNKLNHYVLHSFFKLLMRSRSGSELITKLPEVIIWIVIALWWIMIRMQYDTRSHSLTAADFALHVFIVVNDTFHGLRRKRKIAFNWRITCLQLMWWHLLRINA